MTDKEAKDKMMGQMLNDMPTDISIKLSMADISGLGDYGLEGVMKIIIVLLLCFACSAAGDEMESQEDYIADEKSITFTSSENDFEEVLRITTDGSVVYRGETIIYGDPKIASAIGVRSDMVNNQVCVSKEHYDALFKIMEVVSNYIGRVDRL